MTRLHAFAALIAASLVATPARGQGVAWSPGTSSAADLWFHGLATLGVAGFSGLPLYAPGYAAGVERDKALRGVRSLLDERAAYFRRAFAEDSAFEVFHFAPVYFAGSEAAAMLDALKAVASEGAGAAAGLGPAERFGAVALGSALPTPAERRVLGQLADALADEWSRYYRDASARGGAERAARAQTFARAWRPLAAALAPYLARYNLAGGMVLLSPALGPDGRLFEGDPRSSADNVIAVALPSPDATGADAVFLAVRELCYPAVRAALAATGDAGGDRVRGEELSGRAAVRCGGLLLERYAPGTAPGYEKTWLALTGRPGPLATAFPIPDALAAALAAEIAPR